MKVPIGLQSYESDTHSQNGEDGVLEYVFRHVQPKHRRCVEFGAWDGKYMSNTFALVEQGWKSLMIEGDKARYKDLLKTQKEYPNIQAMNRYVMAKGKDRLDQLLKEAQVPKDFDLLSIDIDSEDYRVWESLKAFSPSVVVVEYNFCELPWIRRLHGDRRTWVQRLLSFRNDGNSAMSLYFLGAEKGYALVHLTACNLFFIRRDLLNGTQIIPLRHPMKLFFKYYWRAIKWLIKLRIKEKTGVQIGNL